MQLTDAVSEFRTFSDSLLKIRPEHIVLAGLFGVALAHWGANTHYSQAFVMAVCSIAALALTTRDPIIGTLGAYLAAWFACQQFALSMGWMPEEVFVQSIDSMTWFMVGLVIYMAVRCGKMPLETYLKGICILATGLSLVGLLSFLGKGAAVATLGNQNFLGAFLAVSALSCYWLPRKWKFCLVPILSCLLATNTSMAIIAFLVGSGYYFFGWRGLVPAVAGGIVYFMAFKSMGSMTIRLSYWMDAADKLSGYWNTIAFGVGPGIYWQYDNMLHSEYVYLLWNFGILGVAIVGLYILRSFREINNRIIFAMFIAILVDGIGNHLMHTAPTAMLAVIILGLKDKLRRPQGSPGNK